MSRFLNPDLLGVAPYVPGEQPKKRDYIKLNTNENPYFPSRYAVSSVTERALDDLRLYSDPESGELAAAIAKHYGLRPENVLPTNGSDEALAFCFRAFCARGAAFPDVTYGFYPVIASLFGISCRVVPLSEDFTVNAEDYLCGKETVVLANPNAQTGRFLPLADVEKIVAADRDRMVLVDEAYVDFGGETAVKLLGKHDNLVVVATFSKSRSLAGARVGFALGGKEQIEDLRRVKDSFHPYNVNRLSAAIAARAIADEKYFDECRARIADTREKFSEALRNAGYEVVPSLANFVLVKSPKIGGGELAAALRERGFLVRHFSDPRIRDYVRISIGKEEDMLALAAVMEETVK